MQTLCTPVRIEPGNVTYRITYRDSYSGYKLVCLLTVRGYEKSGAGYDIGITDGRGGIRLTGARLSRGGLISFLEYAKSIYGPNLPEILEPLMLG